EEIKSKIEKENFDNDKRFIEKLKSNETGKKLLRSWGIEFNDDNIEEVLHKILKDKEMIDKLMIKMEDTILLQDDYEKSIKENPEWEEEFKEFQKSQKRKTGQ
ncbi:MAG: hypothetical protein ACRCUM_02200, partial [Mycoplasmoidaceae bacterium]